MDDLDPLSLSTVHSFLTGAESANVLQLNRANSSAVAKAAALSRVAWGGRVYNVARETSIVEFGRICAVGKFTSIRFPWGKATDAFLTHLAGQRFLTHLDLDGGNYHVSDAGLSSLAGLPLTYLVLRCAEVTDSGLAYLRGMPLRHLNLHFCTAITDTGLLHFKGLPLQHLDLRMVTDLSGKGLSHLGGLTSLEHLALQGLGIADDDLLHLGGLHLVHLDLTTCRRIGDPGLHHTARLFPKLRHLKLAHCAVTDLGLSYLERLPIERLCLDYCANVTDRGCRYLVRLPALRYVSVRGCRRVTGASLLDHLQVRQVQRRLAWV
jgi:hypothetical protein